MCEENEYNKFPSVSIGGGPGFYVVKSPVRSNEYVEFVVVSLANTTANVGTVQVSGVQRIGQIFDVTGATPYSDTAQIPAQIFQVPANNTVPVGEDSWERIANTESAVYVRVDGSNTCVFVTIKFRTKILRRVPAPFTTVKPGQEHMYHEERERRIQAAVYGQEGEIVVYGRKPGEPNTIRKFITGKEPVEPVEYEHRKPGRVG